MENNDLKNKMEKFIGTSEEKNCTGDDCMIKTDKSLIEIKQLNKKVIIEDGRQLLI